MRAPSHTTWSQKTHLLARLRADIKNGQRPSPLLRLYRVNHLALERFQLQRPSSGQQASLLPSVRRLGVPPNRLSAPLPDVSAHVPKLRAWVERIPANRVPDRAKGLCLLQCPSLGHSGWSSFSGQNGLKKKRRTRYRHTDLCINNKTLAYGISHRSSRKKKGQNFCSQWSSSPTFTGQN